VLTLISYHENNRYFCGDILAPFVVSTLTSMTSILGSDVLTAYHISQHMGGIWVLSADLFQRSTL